MTITKKQLADQYSAQHYIGHRQRLKKRLINTSPDSLADYELLELILFFAIPRRDVKPLAKQLLAQFSSLSGVINVDKDRLFAIVGINENLYVILTVVRELMRRILQQKVMNQNVIGSWGALLDYLKITMSPMKVEQFRILFLNKKNILTADEILSNGTIDHAAVYPREIIKRALFNEACAIILVHNHPSGNSKPSKADIEMTNKIVEVCKSVDILVHDHVIIGDNQYFSFKSNMLL